MKTNSARIFISSSALVITCITIALFVFAPAYVEKSLNRVTLITDDSNISARVKTFHQSLTISDLHADSLLWNRDLAKRADYGHVDIQRLIEGNIALQVFSVVTKTPKGLNIYSNSDDTDNITLLALLERWPTRTWFSLYERAVYQAIKLHNFSTKLPDQFFLIYSRQGLQDYLMLRRENSKISAGLLSLEGAHALEGNIDNLDHLYHLGYRIIGFTHFFDNELGGSAHGLKKNGITEFGKQVLKRMQKLGIFVDLSHASSLLIDDILKYSTQPVLVTHTGIQAVCKVSHRNLSDKHIKQIADIGGLIGIGFWPNATCSNDISGIIQSIQYVVDLVGVEHVALGSDFDGNVQVPFTSDQISLLTQSLLENDFSEDQIKKIMGDNVIHFLLNHLPD